MTRGSGDSLGELSRWRRWSLERGLRRTWRLASAERDAAAAARLADGTLDRTVVAILDGGPDRYARTVAEIHMRGGLTIRLARCHWPTVLLLERRVLEGPVDLDLARHHGIFWGLYFRSAAGRFPLLARELRIQSEGGSGFPDGLRTGLPFAPVGV